MIPCRPSAFLRCMAAKGLRFEKVRKIVGFMLSPERQKPAEETKRGVFPSRLFGSRAVNGRMIVYDDSRPVVAAAEEMHPAEKNAEKSGNDLKKREKGCIVIDSDVVYPEYDVRKVPGSGSSGTPFLSGHFNSFCSGGFSRPGKVQLVRFSVVTFSGSHARIFLHWPFCPYVENPSVPMN